MGVVGVVGVVGIVVDDGVLLVVVFVFCVGI